MLVPDGVSVRVSPFALVTPAQTTDVGGGAAATFALERVRGRGRASRSTAGFFEWGHWPRGDESRG